MPYIDEFRRQRRSEGDPASVHDCLEASCIINPYGQLILAPEKHESLESKAHLRVSAKLEPVSRWLRFFQFLRLVPIVVGENYKLSVTFRNMCDTSLTDIEALAHIWVNINSKKIPSDVRLNVTNVPSGGKSKVESYERFLMREAGAGDIQIEGVWADGTRLRVMYQDRPNFSFLTTYEVEPRRALFGRIVGLIVSTGLLSAIVSWLFSHYVAR